MEAVRPRALEIAEYCARWGMRYEERLGSDDYLRRLLAGLSDIAEAAAGAGGAVGIGDDFLIIAPGEEVRQTLSER